MASQTIKLLKSITHVSSTGVQRSFAHGEVVTLDDTVYPCAAWITAGIAAADAGPVGLKDPKYSYNAPARKRQRGEQV